MQFLAPPGGEAADLPFSEAVRVKDMLYLSGQVGHIDAVPHITLCIDNVRRNASKLRCPVDWDGDRSTPCVFDAGIAKLRINLQHPRHKLRFDVFRVHAEIPATSTEQQPVVGAQPEVMQDEIRIARGHVLR